MPGLFLSSPGNMNRDEIHIRRLDNEAEGWACADIMASTDPWLTLGRDREHTHRTVTNPQHEAYIAVGKDGEIAGLAVIMLARSLINGYIAALAVKAEHRNCGIGRRLLDFAEQRIFRESPNVFLCVSSFNTDAQRFYQRLGYEKIGTLKDYVIRGADEHLLRKSNGPWSEFTPS